MRGLGGEHRVQSLLINWMESLQKMTSQLSLEDSVLTRGGERGGHSEGRACAEWKDWRAGCC